MKRSILNLSDHTKAMIIRAADGVLTAAGLFFIFRAVTMIDGDLAVMTVDYCMAYVLMAASYLVQAAAAFRRDRLCFIKFICFAAVLIAVGAAVPVMGVTMETVVVLFESLLAIVQANRVIAAVTERRLRYRVFNILLSLLLVYLILGCLFLDEESAGSYLLAHAVLYAAKALGHIIGISFSQMRFSVLRKILRKTFAAEILFGLVLLIVSFSFVFQALEPGIVTYFDALWYCFAVVTTIGFGDYTVGSLFSRALSVILGIYGIVVVALVTSVIVNFYNEVKDEKDDDEPDGAGGEKSADAPPADK